VKDEWSSPKKTLPELGRTAELLAERIGLLPPVEHVTYRQADFTGYTEFLPEKSGIVSV